MHSTPFEGKTCIEENLGQGHDQRCNLPCSEQQQQSKQVSSSTAHSEQSIAKVKTLINNLAKTTKHTYACKNMVLCQKLRIFVQQSIIMKF